MLALILLGCLVTPVSLAGDDIAHDIVRHADIADGRPSSMDKGFIQTYETAFGYSVSVGDKIAVNVPGGLASTTVAVGGAGTNGTLGGGVGIGTTVASQYFQYIYNGTYAATVGKAMLAGAGGTADPTLYMAPGSLAGAEMTIQRIKLAGTKKRPVIWMECELADAKDRANISGVITVADYDAAMRLGEIYNPNFITREIAIAKLREAKELLDMGVYTPEQFEEVKTKYGPYVTTE
jgi:hypothetical protein